MEDAMKFEFVISDLLFGKVNINSHNYADYYNQIEKRERTALLFATCMKQLDYYSDSYTNLEKSVLEKYLYMYQYKYDSIDKTIDLECIEIFYNKTKL